jgi:aminopeptidase N
VYDHGQPARRVAVELDPAADGGRTPVPALVGTAPGRLLLLNDGDLTYAKVRLDPADPAALAEILPTLTDPLARVLVWGAAMDACRDAELEPAAFVWLAATALPAETTVATFEEVLAFARDVVVNQYLPVRDRKAGLGTLADLCLVALRQAPPGSGLQLAAARGLVSCTGAPDAARLAGWLAGGLAGDGVPAGLVVGPDLRWAALNRLVVLGRAGEAEIAAEQALDGSAEGAEHAARCRAALADPAAKARAWEILVAGDGLPVRALAATGDGFWQPEQEELTAGYVDRYFAEMPAMASRRPPYTVGKIAGAAYPRYAVSAETLAAAEAMLAGGAELTPALRRVVVDSTDDLRRALAARATAHMPR